MAHLRVPRGVVGDLKFSLLTQSGGLLTDDTSPGFTDGLTADQWPAVQFFESDGVTEVTSLWVHDITLETISTASHIHPDPTTGIWRLSTGRYRIRVEVDASQAFTDYIMRVTADIGGGPYVEDHTVTLTSPGDVVFGDSFGGITADEVTVGISTTLDPTALNNIIVEASDWAYGAIEDCGIDPLGALFTDGLPKTVRIATILYARGLVTTYDTSAGNKFRRIEEGSEKVEFAGFGTGSGSLLSFYDRAEKLLEKWCRKNRPSGKPKVLAFRQLPDDASFTAIQNMNVEFEPVFQ